MDLVRSYSETLPQVFYATLRRYMAQFRYKEEVPLLSLQEDISSIFNSIFSNVSYRDQDDYCVKIIKVGWDFVSYRYHSLPEYTLPCTVCEL